MQRNHEIPHVLHAGLHPKRYGVVRAGCEPIDDSSHFPVFAGVVGREAPIIQTAHQSSPIPKESDPNESLLAHEKLSDDAAKESWELEKESEDEK